MPGRNAIPKNVSVSGTLNAMSLVFPCPSTMKMRLGDQFFCFQKGSSKETQVDQVLVVVSFVFFKIVPKIILDLWIYAWTSYNIMIPKNLMTSFWYFSFLRTFSRLVGSVTHQIWYYRQHFIITWDIRLLPRSLTASKFAPEKLPNHFFWFVCLERLTGTRPFLEKEKRASELF